MRYLRIAAVVLLIFSLGFSFWANREYNSGLNTDYPQIFNTEETLHISVDDPEDALFRGLSATDATDGDLTDQIMVASVSHFLEPGTVSVKYVVFDSHSNSATLTRMVHYSDYTAPEFSLDKAPVYTLGSSFDLLKYIRVTDCIDGEIGDQIRVISNLVNNYTAGSYPVVLEVSNSCGDTSQVTIWVTYLNKASTAIVKLHQYIVYIDQGDTFDPQQWIASVTDRDSVALDTANIEIQGNLDVNTPGCYQLVYSYDDGKLSGQCPLTIVVTERQG